VTTLCLYVEVPFCAFRPYTSREYQDTYPVPTPSSLYGMLLSFVGVVREEKALHRGVEMAVAVPSSPQGSRVFRKLRRGDLHQLRPDYQDLLVDVRLWLWLRKGGDSATPDLVQRVVRALEEPATVTRSGGLSLGESSYLVNELRRESCPPDRALFLRPNPQGFYSFPVWVDHVDASKTRLSRFSLEDSPTQEALPNAWFRVDA
jgi:CRISPR-associated protein Cas5t